MIDSQISNLTYTVNKKFLQANIIIAWQKINEQDYLRLTS